MHCINLLYVQSFKRSTTCRKKINLSKKFTEAYYKSIIVKNSMSCHSSALTRCHKLTHLFVTTSGAFTPDFLLHSSNHFMVSHKPHHVLVYQPFLLLICVHQCFLTDSVDHSRYACGYLEDFIFGSTGEQILFHSCIRHMCCDIFAGFCSVQSVQYDIHIDSLTYRRIALQS